MNYYFYYIIPCEFLTLALTVDLSLETERQQVSSTPQDSSQYSARLQLCSSVVFWLVNTSSSNNKTNYDMCGK